MSFREAAKVVGDTSTHCDGQCGEGCGSGGKLVARPLWTLKIAIGVGETRRVGGSDGWAARYKIGENENENGNGVM